MYLLTVLFSTGLSAQCPGPSGPTGICDPAQSQMLITNNPNIEFLFDSFGKINSGIELNGSSIIRIKALNNPGMTCKWNLKMYISNGGGTTPPAEWSALTNYGTSSGSEPTLDLIEVRVSNYCATPIANGQWQTFVLSGAPSTSSSIDIINDILNLNLPGSCSMQQTNTEGSYLTNYGEYSFTVDYRIRPKKNTAPGRYVCKIIYCLSE